MPRSRRCCCCQDVYFGNDDGTVVQFHLQPPSLQPIAENSLRINTGLYLGAVDYRNKRVIATAISASAHTLFYTPTEKLKNAIAISPAQTSGTAVNSVAVDWSGNRIFYS